jgi:hypothetical protein
VFGHRWSIDDGGILPFYGVKLSAKDARLSEVLLGTSWRHIENLGNMFKNTYRNSQKSNIPPSRLDACTSIKMLIHLIHTLGQVWAKIQCPNPTTPMHSHFLMDRVNEPHTSSSDQLGDKQFELKGSIFSSLLDGPIHIYRCLECSHVLGKIH